MHSAERINIANNSVCSACMSSTSVCIFPEVSCIIPLGCVLCVHSRPGKGYCTGSLPAYLFKCSEVYHNREVLKQVLSINFFLTVLNTCWQQQGIASIVCQWAVRKFSIVHISCEDCDWLLWSLHRMHNISWSLQSSHTFQKSFDLDNQEGFLQWLQILQLSNLKILKLWLIQSVFLSLRCHPI